MKSVKEIATKYQVSESTIRTLLDGLKATGGNQVQFNIAELGGMGQWQSGMVMIGDMFNNSLKAKVGDLVSELRSLAHELIEEEAKKESSSKKASDKSTSSATFKGSQNGNKYAYFAKDNLLEIEENGKITRYSTEGYALSGVQQSQSNDLKSLSFSYPGGTVKVKDLKKVK